MTHSYVRNIPVEDGYDLVVAGGGPAGCAAAVCAARLGVKVLLIEATGCLGGMGTSGLVTAFDPMADGVRNLAGGFIREVVETLYDRGYLKPGIDPDTWRKNYHQWTPFHPEGLKIVLDELASQSGVEVRFFTRVIDVEFDAADKIVRGVIINNVEGSKYIKARTFIDCTGDAALTAMTGAPCREAGRDTENIMPCTLASLHAGIDWENEDQTPHDDRWIIIEKAYADGVLSQCDRHLSGMSRIGHTLGYLNGGHVFGLNALKCADLSSGMMFGRKLAQEYLALYRKYLKGYDNMELVTTASLMGVRETRRIVGEYELCFDDYINRRSFPDQIGVFNKFVDIHAYDCSKEQYENFVSSKNKERLGMGEYFGMPYGILVPKGWKNLWVAGRCASADIRVQGSIRVMPACAMMGQAAGTAAVQSIKTGQIACELDTEMLVETLLENGAFLPQTQRSKTMTRR